MHIPCWRVLSCFFIRLLTARKWFPLLFFICFLGFSIVHVLHACIGKWSPHPWHSSLARRGGCFVMSLALVGRYLPLWVFSTRFVSRFSSFLLLPSHADRHAPCSVRAHPGRSDRSGRSFISIGSAAVCSVCDSCSIMIRLRFVRSFV